MVDFHLTTGSITDHDDTKRFGHARVLDLVPRTTPSGEDMSTCHRRLHSNEVHPSNTGDDSLTESYSGKSSHDEEYYENSFHMMDDGMRKSSSGGTMPIVIEVVPPRQGFYHSDDPLFQGVCLYNGCMTDTQREEMGYTLTINSHKEEEAPSRASSGRLSSILSAIFSGHA